MITYSLEKKGNMPIYEYLYNCIKNDILAGRLKAEDKLPSKREMASNMGISVITVTNAYEQLVVEGYIYAVEKRGYFVNDIVVAAYDGENSTQLAVQPNAQTGTQASAQQDVQPNAQHSAQNKSESNNLLIDFTSSHIRYDSFPFNTWAKVMRKTLADNENNFLERPDAKGVRELREAIAEHLTTYRGMDVKSENIIVGAGMEYLYGLIVKLLGDESVFAIEDPGHKKIGKIYEINKIRCVHIPVDENGMTIDDLSENIGVCHITPSHHFPTGYVMPISRRYEFLKWARNNNAYIIEDDYDSEFRFHGRMIPTMQSLNPERVIYLNTFSKTLAPSIRVAYMVLPDQLMEEFDSKLNFYSSTVSSIDQYALARFIREGYYGRHINRMRNFYRNYQSEVLNLIHESSLGDSITVKEADAGLHFIVEINKNIDIKKYQKRLLKKGIKISAVKDYCYNSQSKYDKQFIINYSAVEKEKLKEALSIMDKEIKKSIKKKNEYTIEMPKSVKRIIELLEENGFEGYAVGGCVRDTLLGKNPKDWDITTSAKPEQVKKIFNKTIDTGIEHGTVTVRMRGESYEVTTYRVDGDYSDNRHPESVSYTDSLREDLKRRDFTINAMAYNDSRGLVDEFGGIEDLKNGIIRCVGNPMNRFDEDALRIMRGVRFAAQLNFDIEEETKKAMSALAPNLKDISAERIRTELEKLIMSDAPSKLVDAYEMGITKVILPEFDSMMECEQVTKYHIYDVGIHTIKVMENVPNTKLLRWTALLHDVAKPVVMTRENNLTHFYDHEERGALLAPRIMKRLKMDNKTIKNVQTLILYHDQRSSNMDGEFARRLVNKTGKDLFPDLLCVMKADLAGKSDVAKEKNGKQLKRLEEEFNYIIDNNIATSIGELAVDGKDLIEMGIKPGKDIGLILGEMLEEVLIEPEHNNKEYLLNLKIVAQNT